ncbi:sulfurtransferase-like selenium metabolism protein YedF [Romboutsia sp. 13368]|uniref:sulfurtransferase-like selenium metabolism protein YedF n=1 Tax=Romboutsia sp. 13368 TaxID=2708053 RepID=UPI0025F1CDB2|nr:sulfurtransferase-like selenium metabolism protein YedF [Romboutsia sp. 13368]
MYIEINAVGLACPKPVINTKKELDKIEQGIVVVTVDNDIAKQNILKLSNSLNCKAEIIKQEKDLISIEIKKGENVIIEEKKQDELEDKCIFISSDKIGNGNDELGAVLMKGFIYTLTESKPYPKSILLVNSGVKLSTENYDTVDNLKILEEAGVEILSCGTCLDYYGLKESLKLGSVTNMYTIVDIMKNSLQTISI